jgi:hypothetical protein
MKLFNEELPSITDESDLDSVASEYQDLDRAYLALAGSPNLKTYRQYIHELVDFFEPYSDPNFSNELKRNFYARAWEMYTAYAFDEIGLSLRQPNEEKGPDLLIEDKTRIWVEATSPTQGKSEDAVPDIKTGIMGQYLPEDKIMLRFTNSISTKYQKLIEYQKGGVIAKDDPFVLALNTGSIPYPTMGMLPLPLRAVFGLGSMQIEINPQTMEHVDTTWERKEEIEKQGGSSVSTNYFRDDQFSKISGLIYCPNRIFSHSSPTGSDFWYIHNPHADNPLPQNWLTRGYEYVVQEGRLRQIDRNNTFSD